MVVEVNGVVGRVVQLSEGERGQARVMHSLEGLREGCEYRVRHRVVVGDDALDAAAPWSLPATLRTPTQVELRIQALEVSGRWEEGWSAVSLPACA